MQKDKSYISILSFLSILCTVATVSIKDQYTLATANEKQFGEKKINWQPSSKKYFWIFLTRGVGNMSAFCIKNTSNGKHLIVCFSRDSFFPSFDVCLATFSTAEETRLGCSDSTYINWCFNHVKMPVIKKVCYNACYNKTCMFAKSLCHRQQNKFYPRGVRLSAKL